MSQHLFAAQLYLGIREMSHDSESLGPVRFLAHFNLFFYNTAGVKIVLR